MPDVRRKQWKVVCPAGKAEGEEAVDVPVVAPSYLTSESWSGTIPTGAKPGKPFIVGFKWDNLFPFAFVFAIVWVGIFSNFMVDWATTIGCVLDIPDEVMGLTFLAAGTSVPDLLTSVIVAKQARQSPCARAHPPRPASVRTRASPTPCEQVPRLPSDPAVRMCAGQRRHGRVVVHRL